MGSGSKRCVVILSLRRRGFLKGALATGALVPLLSCVGENARQDSSSTNAPPSTPVTGPDNPFGLDVPSQIHASVFDGGYGLSYAEYAGGMVEGKFEGVTVRVSRIRDATLELLPLFTEGNPPDVIDNAGKDKISLSAIIDQLEDLNDVIDSNNYEGDVIRDTLYAGVLEPGTIGGKLVVINYVLTVFGLWYSSSLFEENGWEPPGTWDDALALGAQAQEQGKYLFLWGNEAADYYLELAITSAIKEGGHEVRLALDNLQEGCWSLPAVQEVFGKMEEIVRAGYIRPGGGGTEYTAAQASWSQAQEALLYPSGAWIGNEMKDQTAEGFDMVGAPVPTLTSSPSLPYEAIHAAAGEPYVVPSQGNNVAGGKELMRAMLSKEAAENFSKEILSLSIVKDTVPEDGFGSTALISQIDMLGNAGDDVFTWKFDAFYGMGPEIVVLWNSFLDGQLTTQELTTRLQEITDRIRNDDTIEKFTAE